MGRVVQRNNYSLLDDDSETYYEIVATFYDVSGYSHISYVPRSLLFQLFSELYAIVGVKVTREGVV